MSSVRHPDFIESLPHTAFVHALVNKKTYQYLSFIALVFLDVFHGIPILFAWINETFIGRVKVNTISHVIDHPTWYSIDAISITNSIIDHATSHPCHQNRSSCYANTPSTCCHPCPPSTKIMLWCHTPINAAGFDHCRRIHPPQPRVKHHGTMAPISTHHPSQYNACKRPTLFCSLFTGHLPYWAGGISPSHDTITPMPRQHSVTTCLSFCAQFTIVLSDQGTLFLFSASKDTP